MRSLQQRTTVVGGIAWVVYVGVAVPDIHHGAWAYALLLLAAFVLVPLAFDLIGIEIPATEPACLAIVTRAAQFPAALLLAWSCTQSPGVWPALAAMPWFVVCGLTALRGCWRIYKQGTRQSIDALCLNASFAFLGIGGAWVIADRVGFRPLDFPDAIVTLTAVHFHYAGLLLPLTAGLIVRTLPSSTFARAASIGVVLGVPAVAVGITMTQLGFSPLFEAIAGGVLAVSGIFIGFLQMRIAFNAHRPLVVRALFLVAGSSLIFGMVLAAIYASRAFFLPIPWLDVPWMRALHGSANAIGFGLCGVLAWRAVDTERTTNR